MTVALRVAVAVAAVLALGWLGIMERNNRLRIAGLTAASHGDIPTAESDLRGARLLNPDPAPDTDRALVKGATGDFAGAVAGLRAIVRDDPGNITAWADLAAMARGHDNRAVLESLVALRKLDPLTASDAPTGGPGSAPRTP